jgi:hypothetical protein
VFAQFADVNIERGEVAFKSNRDHGEIRYALMDGPQRGDARVTDEASESLFRSCVHNFSVGRDVILPFRVVAGYYPAQPSL